MSNKEVPSETLPWMIEDAEREADRLDAEAEAPHTPPSEAQVNRNAADRLRRWANRARKSLQSPVLEITARPARADCT